MIIVWKGKKDKRIELKGENVKATLHLVPNQELSINDSLWKIMEKKMSDDLFCKRLVLVLEK
jgi:hypothetical protein